MSKETIKLKKDRLDSITKQTILLKKIKATSDPILDKINKKMNNDNLEIIKHNNRILKLIIFEEINNETDKVAQAWNIKKLIELLNKPNKAMTDRLENAYNSKLDSGHHHNQNCNHHHDHDCKNHHDQDSGHDHDQDSGHDHEGCCGSTSKQQFTKLGVLHGTNKSIFELKNIENIDDIDKKLLEEAIDWYIYFKYKHDVRDEKRALIDHTLEQISTKDTNN